MKRILLLMIAFLIIAGVFLTGWQASAQSPQKMSFQAVIRNADGGLVSNTPVGIRIKILQTSKSGADVYVETHTAITNANGLASIVIGGGTIVMGNFEAINWVAGPYFLKTETGPAGGTSYSVSGVSQIVSVPYAMHSKTAETADYNNLTNLPALNINNWNTAYSWRNHAGLYRPISYMPTWSEITSKPTNLSGYGITDAVTTAGAQTISGNKTFTGTTTVATPVNSTDAATKAYVDALKDIFYTKLLDAGLNGIVKDVEDNVYKTKKIGIHIWMAENLKVTRYNDGTSIENVTDNSAWSNLKTGAYCWYYNDEATYAATYGALYNWYAVNTGKLCPTGWHVPSDAEWTILTDYLGGTNIAGGKVKEAGTIHWNYPNTNATNESGFTALAGGYRIWDGSYNYIGICGYLWSAVESSTDQAWYRFILNNKANVYRSNYYKENGFYVRCVRD